MSRPSTWGSDTGGERGVGYALTPRPAENSRWSGAVDAAWRRVDQSLTGAVRVHECGPRGEAIPLVCLGLK
jgi:hypothetical protein